MNLLMVSGDRAVAAGKKGAFWYTLEELAKHWERIDIITPRAPVPQSSSAPASSIDNVYFHSSTKGLYHQARFIVDKGRELAKERQYQAMTIHEYPPFYNGSGGLFLAEETDIPSLLEVHHIVGEPVPADFKERLGAIQSRFVLPRHAKRATAVRTVNSTVKDQLVTMGIDEQKIAVLPSAYLDRTVLEGPRPDPVYDVSFAARLVPNKGLDTLLKALVELPNVTLVVIGDGPERSKMEQLAQSLSISDRVTFTGWLDTHEDVIATLKQSKIFVMNSLSEGGPRSALEAMGAGLPVVATPVGVMPDVIQDGTNGRLTTGEKEDLAQIIGQLLADAAARKAMGSAAQGILEKFERESLIGAYATFLQDMK